VRLLLIVLDSDVSGLIVILGMYRQREQAEEGQYIKKMEAEKLKTAQEKLEAAKAELVSTPNPKPHLASMLMAHRRKSLRRRSRLSRNDALARTIWQICC